MAIVEKIPVEVAQSTEKILVQFDRALFSNVVGRSVSQVFSGSDRIYPGGVAADQFDFVLPQFAQKSRITIDFNPSLFIQLKNSLGTYVQPKVNLEYVIPFSSDSFLLDGVPKSIQFSKVKSSIEIQKTSLVKISMQSVIANWQIDLQNSASTPFYVLDLTDVQNVLLYIRPLVTLNLV